MPKKLTIEEMKEVAIKKGGICLSKKYVNNSTKIKWKCKKEHIWMARPGDIKKGIWCSKCSGKAKHTIGDMKKLAEDRGGKCLSKKYINNKIKLKFKCAEGHIWEVKANHVQRGVWCPICISNISEELTRSYFETIFNKKFPKCKLPWLINSRGNKMELDGYCEELGIAFEYQGQQHYFNIHFYHQGRSLKERKEDDELKELACKKRGINLIKIPYHIKYEKIYDFLISELKKKKIKIPQHREVKYYDLDAFRHSYASLKLEELKLVAKNKGGLCLSKKYFGNKNKLKWQCLKGHIWEAKPNGIISGQWCPFCGGTKKLNITEMKKIAKLRGGKCLSDRYYNNETKLRWICLRGHIWQATPHNVKHRKSWCPICAKLKLKR